eukprot:CAMPEP_0175418686 /NCGR_PEP_ID=MMETSP0095-20121207/45845_1 /TAXON_ID=311494 /ORGANISM="Alexandrium monilatum, Strain CCMP3105" /LENGTH=36 /DNA_ID= /DNA_START= /DNA_END= /DNA_ORIENTATION=
MYLPRATISAGSSAVILAENNLAEPVSWMQERMALT